jgi:HK97 gp10 family phage protein
MLGGMAGAFSISGKIDGLGPMLRQLDRLKRGTRNKILRRAVSKASRIVLKAAKANCPQDTGALKRSLDIKLATYENGVVGVIGPSMAVVKDRKTGQMVQTRLGKWLAQNNLANRPEYYAHLVEFGTRPHSVASGDRLGRTVGGKLKDKPGKQTTGAAMNPGAKAKPFLRPAWDTSRDAVRQMMADEIALALVEVIRG